MRQAAQGDTARFGHFASEVEARAAVACCHFLAGGVLDGDFIVKHNVVVNSLRERYGALVRLAFFCRYLRVGEIRSFATGVRSVGHVGAVVGSLEIPCGFYLFAAVRVDTAHVYVRKVLYRYDEAFLYVRRARRGGAVNVYSGIEVAVVAGTVVYAGECTLPEGFRVAQREVRVAAEMDYLRVVLEYVVEPPVAPASVGVARAVGRAINGNVGEHENRPACISYCRVGKALTQEFV